MSENIKPLSAVEGKAYINGIEVMDSVKMTIRFVPKVANYRIVGKKGTHRRWVGYDITGTLDIIEFVRREVQAQILRKGIIHTDNTVLRIIGSGGNRGNQEWGVFLFPF